MAKVFTGLRVRSLRLVERAEPENYAWGVEAYVMTGRRITERKILTRCRTRDIAIFELANLLRTSWHADAAKAL